MKDFLLIANINAITYKEFFPLLKDNIIRPGVVFNKTLEFDGPDAKKQGGISWYTNLQTPPRRKLVLTKTYNPDDYPKYDNYDAVEVSRVKDIPYDYQGTMGVPVTIFDYDLEDVEVLQLCASHSKTPRGMENENCYLDGEWKCPRILIKKNFEPEQFEILGLAQGSNDVAGECYLGYIPTINYDGGKARPYVRGRAVYPRILIRRKK